MGMEINIDTDYLKEVMINLLQIPSPGGDTEEAMTWIEKELEKRSIPVQYTNKKAIIATLIGEDDENQKMIGAHVDTLGAMVRNIKPNGRLQMLPIGGFAWGAVEGENIILKTMDGKRLTGSILPDKNSIHAHSEVVRETLRTDENMEVRLDEFVRSKEDVEALGVRIGDFISFEPRTIITDKGFIKSRFIDDKACIACILAYIKYIKDHGLKLKYTTHIYISNYEEVGHGISVVPEKTKEFLAIDVGIVASTQNGDETMVSICAKDSRTPYDFEFRKKLVKLCEEKGIHHRVDVHYRYGSDASVGVLQGIDVNFACAGPGVDASHHYERTHIKSLIETTKLLVAYTCY